MPVYLISFIFIFLLIAGYRNTSGLSNDLYYYELEYQNFLAGSLSNYEIGYKTLMAIGGMITDDFYLFRSIVIFLSLLLMLVSIKKYSPSPHYVIALFSTYLVILSAEQFRYFIAFSLFVVSLNILLFSDYKFKKIFSMFVLGLATSIHFSFIIYFVVIVLFSERTERTIKEKVLAVITFFFCIVIFINNNTIPGLEILISEIDDSKIQIYLNQKTEFGFLILFLLHGVSLFLSGWAVKLSQETADEKTLRKIKLVHQINILSVLFFPLFMVQITFYRLIRNFLILNYMLFSGISISKKIKLNKRVSFLVLAWTSVICWLYFDLVFKTPMQALLIPFFTENHYLNFKIT
ncbi:EpsG family protein [Exiguobacterium sp. E4787]|uniref:EpsG family protein n=1 Tax=Exiguobacterium sp. E4787 TaxID=2751225 RepID=UPI001BE7916B|nr:EpsG family protein [Exiguobacterium sp. E4787]